MCGTLFVVLLIIGALAGDPDEDQADNTTTTTVEVEVDDTTAEKEPEAETTTTPEDKPATTAAPAWTDGVPLTEEAVVEQLGESPRKLAGANVIALSEPDEVIVNDSERFVNLTYYVETAWDEDAMVRHASHIGYSAARSMFENPNVQRVRVGITTDLVSQGGKSTRGYVATTELTRATVDADIEWDGFGDVLEGNDEAWFCVVDAATIHPAIISGVSDDSCWWTRT